MTQYCGDCDQSPEAGRLQTAKRHRDKPDFTIYFQLFTKFTKR